MERLTAKPIFDGSESIIPLADVVYVEKRHGTSDFAGALSVILRGTTWNHEAGCHNNAAYVPKGEADAFLDAWTRYRSEVDPVQQGSGGAAPTRKLYWLNTDDVSELAVCADDAEAAEIAKEWAREYDAEDAVEWFAVTEVDGYPIAVGEKAVP